MKQCGGIETVNGEFPLPEPIIQHIQSFLSGKEAAQTSLLSKSWHSACSTRPNLDFDERDFGRGVDRFWEFTRKTMQRYEEMKLNIESFRLFIRSGYTGDWYENDMSMVEEVIAKAMKMGTIDFEFENEWPIHGYPNFDYVFILPREVFGSKTLIRLFASGCIIDTGKYRKVSCSGLKSLALQHVDITNKVIWDILSSCPSIENFILKPCLGSIVDGPINLYQLQNLKSLTLFNADVHTSFFSDLSFKFPLLKVLSLDRCYGYNDIKLSSCSLERIYVHCEVLLRARFNVPNLRVFKYSSSDVPSLSFKTASSEWDSNIDLHGRWVTAEWFLKLNELMTCLSSSRITLSLHFWDIWSFRPKIITEDWEYSECSRDFSRSLCSILEQGVKESGSSVFVVEGLKGVHVEVYDKSLAEWLPLPWKALLEYLSAPAEDVEDVKKVQFQFTWLLELSQSGIEKVFEI